MIRLCLVAMCLCAPLARGVVIDFFSPDQTATQIASGATSDTIRSNGYEFTYTRDKYWYATITIGGGTPTGRFTSVNWPDGIQAQAVTAGPNGLLNPGDPAKITIRRQDRAVFDLPSMTLKLLANTGGAGSDFEVMPLLNGNDGFKDPLMLPSSGYGGQSFNYNTPTLVGFDTYMITLYVDYAVTAMQLVDASPAPEPGVAVVMVPIVGWLAMRDRGRRGRGSR